MRQASERWKVVERTPRQRAKASAACSTSMPRPSRGVGAVLTRPAEKACGGRAVHHVVGQAAGAQHARGYGYFGAGQAAGGGVDDEIKIMLQRLWRLREQLCFL
jgi:hypothetical protein